MKLLALLFCISSLNAAVIIQDSHGQFDTTISLNDGIYTYRYDVKSPNSIPVNGIVPLYREFSLWREDDEGTVIIPYKEVVSLSGNYTVEFDTIHAPVEGILQNQLFHTSDVGDGRSGMHVAGWIPNGNVPEPSTSLLSMFGFLLLTFKRRLSR